MSSWWCVHSQAGQGDKVYSQCCSSRGGSLLCQVSPRLQVCSHKIQATTHWSWFLYRCMVEPGNDTSVSKCSFATCMANRQLSVKNNTPFSCKHLDDVLESLDAGTVERYEHFNLTGLQCWLNNFAGEFYTMFMRLWSSQHPCPRIWEMTLESTSTTWISMQWRYLKVVYAWRMMIEEIF